MTQTPWRVVTGAITIAAGRHRVRIASDQEAMADAIATRKEAAVARAALIVTAVNANAALVEASRATLDYFNRLSYLTSRQQALVKQVTAALAAAEGKAQ